MLKLSIKYLLSRKPFLTLFGIILGSFAFVTINGFFQGFQGFLLENLIKNNAHIKITPKDSTPTMEALRTRIYKNGSLAHFINHPKHQKPRDFIQSPELWYRRLKLDKDVVAFSPQITSKVTQLSAPYAVRLAGVDPEEQIKITEIELEKKSGLANKVGSYLSDYITIGDGPSRPFKVRGIFSTRDFDGNTIYANIEDAWEIIKARGRINSIEVRLKDFKDASLKVSHWKAVSDERIESWDQINKNFLNVFKIQNVTRYLMVLITFIVASFGIFNGLNMMVNNKKKDIAIFGALGFVPKQISRIFINQGIILGLIGGIIGLILGYFGCLFIETIPMGAESGHLNVSFEISIYIKGFLLVFFSSVISSYFPSRAAFRLAPIDIIRGQSSDA